MPANTDPIYSRLSDYQGGPLIVTAAATVYDISGTIGTDIYKIFTADATNGGFVQKVRFKYAANGTTTSVATTLKVWISSVASGTPTIGTPCSTQLPDSPVDVKRSAPFADRGGASGEPRCN